MDKLSILRIFTFFFISCFFLPLGFGQELPRYMAEGEEELMPAYIEQIKSEATTKNITNIENPRTLAEWEELQGVAIAWSNSFKSIQAQIIEHATDEVMVYIVTENVSAVKSYLNQQEIDYSENVSFVEGDYNSIWIRDYGPNSVYINGVDSLVFVDWIYNRPRPKDDKVPGLLSNYIGLETIETIQEPEDLVHTGGNFMSNGFNQAFSSELVLEENGPNNNWGISNHSEEDVDNIMNKYMGISEYIKMENLPFDLIHHIDMHMKLLDEETLIVGEYPEGVADGPQIEANLQYVLDNFDTKYGRPFNVIRVPMPPDAEDKYPDDWGGDYRTYANAVILNRTILVPVYEEQYDTTALNIWEDAMPGHEVVGIDCNSIIPLSGAIHCITKEIGVPDPILIDHQVIRDPIDPADWDIVANVTHRNDIDQVTLYYSIDNGENYNTLSLENTEGNTWEGSLYDQTHDLPLTIYYLEAVSSTGKTVEKPLTGSNGGGWRYVSLDTADDQIEGKSWKIGDVFPNPASQITAIPFEVQENTQVKVELINLLGQKTSVVYNGMYQKGKTHLFFNADEFDSGTYMVAVYVNNQIAETQKVIIY